MGLEASEFLGGIPGVDAGLENIFCDDGSSADYDVVGNTNWEDSRVRTDRYMISNDRRLPLAFIAARGMARGKRVIDEHHAMRNEAMISDLDQFADEYVRLDLTKITYSHSLLDFDERTDARVVADKTIVEIDGLDDDDILAENDIADSALFHDRLWNHGLITKYGLG